MKKQPKYRAWQRVEASYHGVTDWLWVRGDKTGGCSGTLYVRENFKGRIGKWMVCLYGVRECAKKHGIFPVPKRVWGEWVKVFEQRSKTYKFGTLQAVNRRLGLDAVV